MPPKKRKSMSIDESEDLFPSQQQKGQKRRLKDSETDDDERLRDESVFGQLVTGAGFVLKRGDLPNMLKCDQAMFQRDLRRRLKSHTLYDLKDATTKFMEGLENHCEIPSRLKWALLYTQTEGECVAARGGQQDSLVRLCLNLEELQPPLITLLTEKLLVLAHEEQDDSQTNIINLILANLKWLDHIADPDTLTASIIDIIQGAPLKVQQEVVSFVPNIVDDGNHTRVAEVLCDLYHSSSDLTPAILDSLSQLSLPGEALTDVRYSVLKALQATQPRHLPVVVKFLLSVTEQNIAYQIVSDMREKIHLIGENHVSPPKAPLSQRSQRNGGLPAEEAGNYELLLLNSIKMATLSHKFLANAWLKAIQDVGAGGSVRALDLLVLLMLYEAMPSQRQACLSIIRNKFRTGLFSHSMLSTTFTSHITVLKDNFEPLKKIAGLLLRSPEPLVSQGGSTLYRLSFLNLGQYARQEVVLALLRLMGDNGGARGAALSLLYHLAHNNTDIITPFTMFIKGSLDCVEELSDNEVRKVVDIVSLLVFSSTSHLALQEELIIMVRKQLSHTDLRYKHIGVLNAAFVVKNMIGLDEESMLRSESTESISTDGTLLNTSALKEVENLLELVISSTIQYPTASALFMDEIASITLKDGLHPRVQGWAHKKMTDDFLETFLVESTTILPDQDKLLVPLSPRWSLLSPDDPDSMIVNLGPMVIKAQSSKDSPQDNKTELVCLAPQFRLLRMLESRVHDGCLQDIDMLLVCPLYAPPDELFEEFTTLTQPQQHAALACLFYIANWFREIINAFVTQKDPEIKINVYKRLETLLAIEKMIQKYLPQCTSYTPPPATFHLDASPPLNLTLTSTGKAKKGRKPSAGKKKKGGKEKKGGEDKPADTTQVPNTQVPTQLMATLAPTPLSQSQKKDNNTTNAQAQSEDTLDMACLRPFLRELHLDVFNLLFKMIDFLSDSCAETQMLTIPITEFLLTDLNFKLTHVFGSTNKRLSPFATDKSVGCSHLTLFTARDVLKRTYYFVKPVCVHLEQISTFFQQMIADNDGMVDAGNMFSDKTKPLILLNKHLFTTLSIFFSWSGLHQEENQDFLTSMLRTVAKKLEGSEAVKTMEMDELCVSVCRYLANFQPSIVSLSTATTLAATLSAITNLPHNANNDLTHHVVEVLEAVLKREWYTMGGDRDRGTVYNNNVSTLLQEYVKQSESPLNTLEGLCSGALQEFMDAPEKNPYSETFPTLNKSTLGQYYRVIMLHLVSGTKKALSLLSSSSPEDKNKRFMVWDSAIKILHTSIMVLKKYSTTTILTSCLKYSRLFIEMFVRSGMPLMDASLRQHNHDVVTLLKSLQASTRFLQNVCIHSKVKRDVSLTAYVPPLKKCLEMLVYRVKVMLALNNCTNAFWIGTLKNRDLQGQELLSQSTMDEEEEETNEEEEETVNNEESDVELEEEEGEEEEDREVEDKTSDYSSSF